MMRPIAAVISAFVVMFGLAGLYTQVLVRDFIATHVDAALLRMPPNLMLVAAGYLVLAIIMVLVYQRVCMPSAKPLKTGFLFGCVIAVLWLMPYSLVLFGVYRFPYAALPIDFAWAFVEQGLAGAAIGAILGTGEGVRKTS
jgi:hypothetical protein